MEIADAIIAALNGPRGGEIATLVQDRARAHRLAQVSTVREIQERTALACGTTREHLTGNNRTRATTFARHVAMYLARRMTPASLIEIGRAFDRDHTTVMAAVRRVEKMVDAGDDRTLTIVDRVTREIRGE